MMRSEKRQEGRGPEEQRGCCHIQRGGDYGGAAEVATLVRDGCLRPGQPATGPTNGGDVQQWATGDLLFLSRRKCVVVGSWQWQPSRVSGRMLGGSVG